MSEDTASTPQEEALAEEIESTRQRLGETVEALVAKTDVKRRAQRRAAEVTGSMRGKARDQAHGARDKARGARDKARGVRDQARDQARGARDQARDQARGARDKARAAKDKVMKQEAPAGLREHRAQVAAAVAAVVLAWLVVRRLRR